MTTRRHALTSAITRLRDVLAQPENDVSRDAAIQRFEFCFELLWKAIQERARDEGLDCQSPKSCLTLAFKASWVVDEREWLAMLADRNQTSHTYDEDLAKAVLWAAAPLRSTPRSACQYTRPVGVISRSHRTENPRNGTVQRFRPTCSR